MEDKNETEGVPELLTLDSISVGLALSDRTLRSRVISMISQMPAIKLEDVDEADVILTDTAPAQPGLHLVLGTTVAMQATISGVDKGVGIDVLEAAICLVAHGYQITHSRIGRAPREATYDDPVAEGDELLTTREHQVLEKLAAGGSNKSIARDLNISIATAKFHVGSLLTKLDARNRTDAVAIGLRLGLLVL